jgi:hypothetical protein
MKAPWRGYLGPNHMELPCKTHGFEEGVENIRGIGLYIYNYNYN